MKREFELQITILIGGEKESCESGEIFSKSVSLKVEGEGKIYADRVREIFKNLCDYLCSSISDTEFEKAINKKS